MKKMNIMNNINKLYKTSALAIIAVLFGLGAASCEVGLGSAVDMEAPTVAITSHQDNESVPQSFELRGTASDNEEVTMFTIDFDDADIHYQIVPGADWQKKTSKSNDWQTVATDANNYCIKTDEVWNWSVVVNTDERAASKQGHTYNFSASATDARGNTGKNSKQEMSLIVDTESPDVSIYKPEIFDSYAVLKQDVDAAKYKLKDGNILSSLLNGTIQLFGRQDQALSFKALRIEFDNGQIEEAKTTVNTQTSVTSIEEILALQDAQLADASAPTVYFSKTLTDSDLREWSLTVTPEEWATNSSGVAYGLNTGLHIIRVISTSLSSSNAWQRKVLGYFLWWPEADKPWITIAAGDEIEKDTGAYECYPGSNISGNIQDDDGIVSFVTTLYERNKVQNTTTAYTYPDGESGIKTHALPQTNAGDYPKYSAWTVVAPAENGSYKIVLELTDVYGNKDKVEKYFDISDVRAPQINITSPLNDTSAIINANGDITFTGTISDDGKLESVAMVWLNPALRNNPANKIKYLTGNDKSLTGNDDDPDWSIGTATGKDDGVGNKIFKFTLSPGQNELTLNKTINLFTDLKIGGKYGNDELLLCAQDFIFRAYDGHKATVKAITLTGDTEAPELSFTTITIEDETKNIADSPLFGNNANNKAAVISGTWSDKFNSTINNTSRFLEMEVTWGTGDQRQTATNIERKPDGTWTADISAPRAGGTITARLRDVGNNTKTIQGAARIETSDLGLARFGCLNDDGAYKEGSVIQLTVEFTKNTTVDTTDGIPYLLLNNGKKAEYKSTVTGNNNEYGSGTAIHVYEYKVGSAQSENIAKLSVSKIKSNGAVWKDSAILASGDDEGSIVTDKIITDNFPPNSNLADSRTIKIDNVKPTIIKIEPVSTAGYFAENASILLKMEFSEDVTITNSEDVTITSPDSLKVQFTHKKNGNNVTTTTSTVSGSKYILFEYKVDADENANPLTFDSILNPSVKVKDLAGNELDNWTPADRISSENKAFTGFVVDTEKPVAPGFGTWAPQSVIFSESGTSFTITGEDNAEIEYTTDGGINWIPYTDEVIIKNNGTYHVKARQTDQAGNESPESAQKDFTIDKGELLTKITASTSSGTYSTKTAIKVIEGRIEFRKPVTIASGAKVTLNVKNGSNNTKQVAIKECDSGDHESNVFTFDYTITEGDSITGNAKLDVVDWSFSTVTFKDANDDTVTVDMAVPAAGNDKRLNENRDIHILTGTPTIADGKITLTEEEGKPVLKVGFDRAITKLSGNITLTQNTTAGNYHIPTVLSVDEYNDLIRNSKAVGASTVSQIIKDAYQKGVNGALLDEDTNTLENDTTTKYVLKFDINDAENPNPPENPNDPEDPVKKIISAFIAAEKHIVSIPVVADDVTIVNENTLRIDLSSSYKLPVKGASYSVRIQANLVADSVQNINEAKSATIDAPGVEKPVIRLSRPQYTINGISDEKTVYQNTEDATIDMTSAQTATMRIDCRTPGAIIKYSTNETTSAAVTVNKRGTTNFKTKTDDPAVIAADDDYSANAQISLASDKAVNTYTNASGVKVAIAATASKNNKTETSYEFAARTVLKFRIQSYWGNNNNNFDITVNGGTLNSKKLKVWVMGGDSPYGGNTKDPFPLSWSDPSHFMIMDGEFANNNNMQSTWYLVTWDISAQAYHGFAIGTVPNDAMTNGPTEWYIGENSWVGQKTNYVLYPGETLIMDTADTDPTYWFRGDRPNYR